MEKSSILLCYLANWLNRATFQIQSVSWFRTEMKKMKKVKLYLLSKMMAEIEISEFVSETQCGKFSNFPATLILRENNFKSILAY